MSDEPSPEDKSSQIIAILMAGFFIPGGVFLLVKTVPLLLAGKTTNPVLFGGLAMGSIALFGGLRILFLLGKEAQQRREGNNLTVPLAPEEQAKREAKLRFILFTACEVVWAIASVYFASTALHTIRMRGFDSIVLIPLVPTVAAHVVFVTTAYRAYQDSHKPD